jgi:hypothetical protein
MSPHHETARLLVSLLANPWLRQLQGNRLRPDPLEDLPDPKPATPSEIEALRADRLRRKRENWLKRQPKGKH